MRGVFYRTEKDGTPLATPELRISATNNRTVYYDNQTAKEAALQNDEIKEGSIVLTGYADGEAEVLMKQKLDWERVQSFTAQQLFDEYTAPEDGVVYITGRVATPTTYWITINHQKVGCYNSNNGILIDCQVDSQVNKGDVITSSNLLNTDYSGIFVPFKTVGEPLTLPVNVMNNPSLPDWSRAISITAAQLQTGYTAPDNGFIVGNGAGTSAVTELSINNVICGVGTYANGTFVRLNICATVQSGNIVKTSANLNTVCQISFVPFKS